MPPTPVSKKYSISRYEGGQNPWMALAIEAAEQAGLAGEVPIGAVLVFKDQVVASANNAPIGLLDPTAHAEIRAIRQACQQAGNYRLGADYTLYVTLMPCLMCLGAITQARIGRVVVGASESRFNGGLHDCLAVLEQVPASHPCHFELGCMQTQCESLLTDFFAGKRPSRAESIAQIQHMIHLPNASKAVVARLASWGFLAPVDLLAGRAEGDFRLAACIEALAADPHCDPEELARLRGLLSYVMGGPALTWRALSLPAKQSDRENYE